MAIVIPFDVFDLCRIQYGRNSMDDIITNIFSRKIKHQLISAKSRFSFGYANCPIRMRPIQLAVGIDTFGLKPKPELHPHTVNGFGERIDSARKLFAVDSPIAKSRVIVVSFSKPSVIENEHLDAQPFCFPRKGQELAAVKIEKRGFPIVDYDGTLNILKFRSNDMTIHKIMHICRKRIDAVLRIAHHRLRRIKALARRKLPEETMRIDTAHHAKRIVISLFNGGIMIAAVNEIEAVNLSPLLIRALCFQKECGIMTVGGATRCGIVNENAVRHFSLMDMRFLCPTAVKRQHSVICRGHIKHKAHQFSDIYCAFAFVCKRYAPGNHVAVFKNRIVQGKGYTLVFFITKDDVQRFCFSLGIRQTAFSARECAFRNAMLGINKIHNKASVRHDQFYGRMSEISLTNTRIFKRQGIERITCFIFLIIHRSTEHNRIFQSERLYIGVGNSFSVMNMLGVSFLGDGKNVAGITRMQFENIF